MTASVSKTRKNQNRAVSETYVNCSRSRSFLIRSSICSVSRLPLGGCRGVDKTKKSTANKAAAKNGIQATPHSNGPNGFSHLPPASVKRNTINMNQAKPLRRNPLPDKSPNTALKATARNDANSMSTNTVILCIGGQHGPLYRFTPVDMRFCREGAGHSLCLRAAENRYLTYNIC